MSPLYHPKTSRTTFGGKQLALSVGENKASLATKFSLFVVVFCHLGGPKWAKPCNRGLHTGRGCSGPKTAETCFFYSPIHVWTKTFSTIFGAQIWPFLCLQWPKVGETTHTPLGASNGSKRIHSGLLMPRLPSQRECRAHGARTEIPCVFR